VTVTTDSNEKDAITSTHLNFSGYVGHATVFSSMITVPLVPFNAIFWHVLA